MKIKTGDSVRVIAGKEKGKDGKIVQVFLSKNRVVVEGLNLMTRHLKGTRGERTGQKIQFSSPIHVSNVQLISAKSGATGRIGYKIIERDGSKEKIRILRKKGGAEDIE